MFIDPKQDDWKTDAGHEKLRKLGRGVANITTGVLEVPSNINEINKDEGGIAALTYGTARGMWRFFVRSLVVGPWEVLTFPTDTEIIIEPEFPFAAATSDVSWRIRR